MTHSRHFDQSSKLKNVLYEIRGRVPAEAARLEAEGHSILKLNTGNPAIFGFEAPHQIVHDMLAALPTAHGYSDSKGIISARRAVVSRYEQIEGFPPVDPDDVYLGNGVSELITMTMQALLDEGDEVLIPAPDYPLWTAMTSLAGGTPVHYLCDEDAGWEPDLEDIRSKVTPRTKAIVIINPNNPTGVVYSRAVLEGIIQIARENELLLLSDEIYDRIVFDGAEHIPTATIAPDLLCLTFNGLSKTYRVAGFRSGWLVITGPQEHAKGFIEGITLLASTRLCPNVPAQHAVQTALGGYQSIRELIKPGGRLYEQRDHAWRKLTSIPGVECVKPRGALYLFARLDPEVHKISDDQRMIVDLLEQQHLLLSHGSGFNLPTTDHLRMVFLAPVDVLDDATDRLAHFLAEYRQ